MDFVKAFNDWAEKAKVAFDDDRTATIGGSEIGACARMVGYRKSSTPADAGYVDGGGFAARGNVMEDGALVPVVRSAVEELGGTLLWAGQADQMRLVNEKRKVSSTPDGLAINMPKDCLAKYGVKDITNGSGRNSGEVYVEFKSIDPRFSTAKLPKDAHTDQVNLGMGLIRDSEFEDGLVYEPNYAVIIYMDASDYSNITVCVVAFDKEGYKGQLQRAKYIMDAVAQGPQAVETLRPEGKIAGGGDCKYCAFSKRCLGYVAMVPKATQVPDKKVATKIRRLAGMLRRLKDKSDDFDKKAKVVEASLKEALAAAQTKWLDLGDVKLNWNTSDGSERFDTDTAKKALEATRGTIVRALAEPSISEDLYDMLKALSSVLEPNNFVKRTKPSESLRVEYVKALSGA